MERERDRTGGGAGGVKMNDSALFKICRDDKSAPEPAVVAEWSKLPCFKFEYRQTLRSQV